MALLTCSRYFKMGSWWSACTKAHLGLHVKLACVRTQKRGALTSLLFTYLTLYNQKWYTHYTAVIQSNFGMKTGSKIQRSTGYNSRPPRTYQPSPLLIFGAQHSRVARKTGGVRIARHLRIRVVRIAILWERGIQEFHKQWSREAMTLEIANIHIYIYYMYSIYQYIYIYKNLSWFFWCYRHLSGDKIRNNLLITMVPSCISSKM